MDEKLSSDAVEIELDGALRIEHENNGYEAVFSDGKVAINTASVIAAWRLGRHIRRIESGLVKWAPQPALDLEIELAVRQTPISSTRHLGDRRRWRSRIYWRSLFKAALQDLIRRR